MISARRGWPSSAGSATRSRAQAARSVRSRQHEERVEAGHERHPGVDIASPGGQVPGGQQVGQLGPHAGVGGRFVGAVGPVADIGGQLDRPGQEGRVGGVPLSSGGQVVEGEGAHRLEGPVAEAAGPPLHAEHRRVHQPGDVPGRHRARSGTEALGGGQVDTAGEDRDAAQQAPLGGVEGPERPVDRVPQRAVAGVDRGPAALQQVERGVEPGVEVGERQRPDPAGGQLQRQRQAVEAADDVGHHQRVVALEHQVGLAPAGMRQERGDRRDRGDVAPARLRHRQRAQPEDVLGGQAQGLARRGEHGQVGAAVDQRGGQLAGGVDDVLAVVEHQHGRAAGQRVAGRRPHLALRHPEPQRRGQRRGDTAAVLHRGELHDGHGPPALGGGDGRLQRQPGLAHPARSHHRYQPPAREAPAEVGQLAVPAHQRRRRPGRRAARRRDGRRADHPLGDLPLDGGEGRARVEAGLLHQAAPDVVGGPERVGLPAGPGEGGDEQRVGPLPEGLGGGGPGGGLDQVGRHLAGLGRQPGLEPVVGEVAPQLGQGDGVGLQRGDTGELVQGRAPPQAEGAAELVDRGAGPGQRPGLVDVELPGRQVEPVAGALADEAVAGRPEVAAQPGDVAVQRPAPGPGHLARPHGVEQLVGGHGAAAGHGQQREHRPPAGPRHVDALAVDREPQRAEQPDPHPRRPPVLAHL